MREAILHIGLPKTGSTTIQNALYRARATLLNHGILYPSIAPNHTDALCTLFQEDPSQHITNQIEGHISPGAIAGLQAEYAGKLDQELTSRDWRWLLLSAEGVSNLHDHELIRLRDWISGYAQTISVVVWVRHPVNYCQSVAQQLLTGGRTMREVLPLPQAPDFRDKIKNAIDVFGRDHVHLAAFEDAIAHEFGLVGYFCSHAGFGQALNRIIDVSEVRSNPSMSMLAARLIDSLNTQRPVLVNGVRNPLRPYGDVEILMRVQGPRFTIPADAKVAIREAYRADVAWLNKQFGVSFYLDVFDDEPYPTDSSFAHNDDEINSLALVLSDLYIGIAAADEAERLRKEQSAMPSTNHDSAPRLRDQTMPTGDVFPYEIRDGEFEIDDIRFHIDISPGHPRVTDAHAFTLVKNKPFLDLYAALVQRLPRPRSMLEIGIYQGGSYVLFDKLFRPERMSALDLSREPVPRLMEYISRTPNRFVHFATRQDDGEALNRIVAEDLAGQLDLVVDDASHLLGFTKKSFEVLFPQLSPGGAYVIEDWSWSHQPPYQGDGAAWSDQPGLSNMLFELIALFASTGFISEINVYREFAVIHKSKSAPASPPPSDPAGIWSKMQLRNKQFSYI